MKLWLDFETYSEINIKKHGGYRYCMDASTKVVCLAYAFDDEPVLLWTPGDPVPHILLRHVESGASVYAHNAVFDMRVWNHVACRNYGWPEMSIYQVVDTAGLGASFTLPLGLGDAGAAMNINMLKSTTGNVLIKKICTPDKQGKQPDINDPKYREDYDNLLLYCVRDVEAMREMVSRLPRSEMTDQEAAVWRLTQQMNATGLPIAYDEVQCIKDYLDTYIKDTMSRVPIITRGTVQTVGQIGKLRTWCADQNYPMPNLQIPTVVEALADPKCPADVKDLLFLRQELGRTSTAKYRKVLDLAVPGQSNSYWVHDNLIYHGASTGRWTGRGFQMQNLPRASVENPEEVIRQFMSGETVSDPVTMGKALIRPMIRAPEGWSLIVSDYSSVENRILHWLAGDIKELENFRQGRDQYKDMAAALYTVDYDNVTKAQRKMGKVIILGAGYGMGPETFQKTAKLQFNMELTEIEAKEAIAAYRSRYPLVVDLWTGLKKAAIKVVLSGQKHTYNLITFGTATVKGVRWLAAKLPNGKCIYYMSPQVEQHHIPRYEHMGKVPTITHMGFDSYARKWCRMKLTPSRITENADQGTAREFMAEGMLNIHENMLDVELIGTVHDECLGLIRDSDITDSTMASFDRMLCDVPWSLDCPLATKGYISKRYRKE